MIWGGLLDSFPYDGFVSFKDRLMESGQGSKGNGMAHEEDIALVVGDITTGSERRGTFYQVF